MEKDRQIVQRVGPDAGRALELKGASGGGICDIGFRPFEGIWRALCPTLSRLEAQYGRLIRRCHRVRVALGRVYSQARKERGARLRGITGGPCGLGHQPLQYVWRGATLQGLTH
jgi:hypothetical protein